MTQATHLSRHKQRPLTTLFMLQSLDGKITPGDQDELDFDKDFPRVPGVLEGVEQFYEIEKTLPTTILTTGRTLSKIGVNLLTYKTPKISSSYIVIDSKPHLTRVGVEYLARWLKKLMIVTTNAQHPAFQMQKIHTNIEVMLVDTPLNLPNIFEKLYTQHKIKRLTIQSGGTLNAQLIRQGLIDRVSVVIAPCLIGGTDTMSLVGGESIHTKAELALIKSLTLETCTVLEDSFIHLVYNLRS